MDIPFDTENVAKCIREARLARNMSQEELAERIYVTRQSISNWETGKTYPDIASLLRLSEVFQVSLDQLIKGDLETMQQEISKQDIEKFNRYGVIFNILFAVMVLSVIPLILWPSLYLLLAFQPFYAYTLYFAFKVEKLKKANKIRTYKEIDAFIHGKRLDEIETAREDGKWPYQRGLLAAASGLAVIFLAAITLLLLRWLR